MTIDYETIDLMIKPMIAMLNINGIIMKNKNLLSNTFKDTFDRRRIN